MTTGDVEDIGKHCELEYCGRLDFLPRFCLSCKKYVHIATYVDTTTNSYRYYCVNHSSETAHKCADAGRAAREARENEQKSNNSNPVSPALPGKPNSPTLSQCSKPTCKTLMDTTRHEASHCARCNRNYCLSHRHEEQHDCSTLTPIGARPATVQQRTQTALSKLKLWAENKRAEDAKRRGAPKKTGFFSGLGASKSAAVSAQTELNTLKRLAKGDAKVAPEKRIYLYVEASSETTNARYPTGKFFYNKDISVGRVLDMAAKALMVENVNNRSEREEDKLRVFHVEAGRLLKFSEKIGDVVVNGNMLVLLRGVGDGEPDLMDP